MTVAERTEEEQLLNSWLNGDVACGWSGYMDEPEEECQKPATWRAFQRCKHVEFLCDAHRNEHMDGESDWFVCECGSKTRERNVRWAKL